MPHMNQGLVETGESVRAGGSPATLNDSCFSASDKADLSLQFPKSPINGIGAAEEKFTNFKLIANFANLCVRGNVDSEYWSLGESSKFNRDYEGYGDLTPSAYDFAWEEAGDPVNSFLPNLMSSPGVDGASGGEPSKQLAPGKKVKDFAGDSDKKGSAPFEGVGTLLSPESSRNAGIKASPWAPGGPAGSKTPPISENPPAAYVMGESGFYEVTD